MISIDHIREQVPLASVLPETAADGACPLCNTGRFRLSVGRGFYTYSDCGEKGDVIRSGRSAAPGAST